ncbi:hypothetical protein K2173_017804 [Erythroxylum novogranatense]|uniref:Rab-GAP TBC domain-containing protein n=1 Tax=Erythroxylum novogranatense TaxID=1862640 RepID=A0AAV8SMI8_9ROSI|nr:hypothetical protein K2173_017804 [Erythroxylum novogranatense]
MFRGKLKLPDKARRGFPDRLGSLVAGLEGKEDDMGAYDSLFESGEELDIILPNGLDLAKERDYDFESDHCDDDSVGGVCERLRDREDTMGQKGSDKHGSVSVLEAIVADEKRSDLEYEFSQKEINLEKLRRIAGTGLPDGGGLRATAWKILLGYLPTSRDLWEKELSDSRQKYTKLKEELLSSPTELTKPPDDASTSDENAEDDVAGPLKRREISHEDHPLSDGKASAWRQYFQHTEIAEQIDRDLQRTHPEMKFFSGDSSFSKKIKEAMRNILLLFAKLNPAIRYVQGMNEVLAPIIYVFSTDTDEDNAVCSNFCFSVLKVFVFLKANHGSGIQKPLCHSQTFFSFCIFFIIFYSVEN